MNQEIRRDKLVLTKEEAKEIIYGDNPNFEVISKEIIDNRRWSIDYLITIKDLKTNKFYQDSYSRGATESQDEGPYDYSEPDFTEVFPVIKTITVYE